jgi:hypothetical protein
VWAEARVYGVTRDVVAGHVAPIGAEDEDYINKNESGIESNENI